MPCPNCYNDVAAHTEDYQFEQYGVEIVLRECSVYRCSCGFELAEFDPAEVHKDFAIYLLQQEEKLSAKQAAFLLQHIVERTSEFPQLNQIGQA